MHRNAGQHLVHTDFLKTCDQFLVSEFQIDRLGDNDCLVLLFQVFDRYFSSFDRMEIEAVLIDIISQAHGRMDHAVLIHESELLQMEVFFHLGLILLQMLFVLQITRFDHFERDIHILDPPFQVVRNDLFPAACQLIQIQVADRFDGCLRTLLRSLSHPNRPQHEDQHDQQHPAERDQRAVFSQALCCLILIHDSTHVTLILQPFSIQSFSINFHEYYYNTKPHKKNGAPHLARQFL